MRSAVVDEVLAYCDSDPRLVSLLDVDRFLRRLKEITGTPIVMTQSNYRLHTVIFHIANIESKATKFLNHVLNRRLRMPVWLNFEVEVHDVQPEGSTWIYVVTGGPDVGQEAKVDVIGGQCEEVLDAVAVAIDVALSSMPALPFNAQHWVNASKRRLLVEVVHAYEDIPAFPHAFDPRLSGSSSLIPGWDPASIEAWRISFW